VSATSILTQAGWDVTSGAGASVQLTPALRALALILVIDLAIGLWLKLHDPDNLALFFLVNAPVIGIGSALWGLFPKAEQESASNWLSHRLGSPTTIRLLLVLSAVLLLVSLFFSSIEINLVDPGTAASVMVVRGSQDRPDSVAVRAADTIRLNRLTTPARSVVRVNPLGSKLWLYSATLTSYHDLRLWPWVPARFQYPDDFVPLAAIAVLPWDTLAMRLRDSLWLTLRQGSRIGPVLSRALLDRPGFTVGYFAPARPSPLVLQRWSDSLLSVISSPDTARRRAYVEDQVGRWARGRWVVASRPIRVGEDVFWDVRGKSNSVHAEGKFRVTDAISDLHLRF
jgi:hypothetical protein